MQLTIDSNEPLDRVLEVVGSLYGVRLAVSSEAPAVPVAAGSRSPREAAPRARRTRSRGTSVAARSHRGRPTATTTGSPDNATIRQWAQANGVPVKDRGRIPASVVDAYHQRDRAAE